LLLLTDSNLNSQLKLLFCLLITTNNNLPLKTYYKNVMDLVFLEPKKKSLSPQPCFPRCLTNQISIKKSQKVKLLDRKSIKKKKIDG